MAFGPWGLLAMFIAVFWRCIRRGAPLGLLVVVTVLVVLIVMAMVVVEGVVVVVRILFLRFCLDHSGIKG